MRASKKVSRKVDEEALELTLYWLTREGLLPRAWDAKEVRARGRATRLHTRQLFERFERFICQLGESGRVSYPHFRVALQEAGFDVRAQWTWANKKVLHARLPE